MRRCLGAVWVTPLALFLLVAPAAMAREEGGNPCTANDSAAGWTVINLTNPPNADVFMVPTLWRGIITRWKVRVGAGLGPLAQQLVVFEQTFVEEETQYRKVGESAMETVVPGSNEFATRIPLNGERHHYLGLHGPLETLFCDKQELAISGVVTGDFPVGEARPVEDEAGTGIGTPVTAISESDLDQDGYGDETQDGCYRSAAIQGGCPTVTPSAVARVEPGAIVVSVRTDSEGLVKVAGQTGWRVPPKSKKGAKASKRVGGRFVVPLRAAEEKTVPPGPETVFRVPLPKSVKRRLSGMRPSRSLQATITATATDLAYRETSTSVSVKLRGRQPPRRRP
jgi:hypothetical protein